MALISIIGLPRSGTTLLGRVLSSASDVEYFEEPNPMWRYRNWQRLGHEQFLREHATPQVRQHIRNYLVPARPRARHIVEKTPSNCLRVGFVEAVVPEARLIFITRNPEDVRRSMLRKWRSGSDSNAARLGDEGPFRELRGKLAKFRFVHRREMPRYIGAEIGARWKAARHGHSDFWGPQFEGWQAYKGKDPQEVVDASCARMEQTLAEGIAACTNRHVVMSYEDLVAQPRQVLAEAMERLDCTDLDLSQGLRFFEKGK
ncbi:sulfotransferase [Mameliella alba]|nr:sulfotransferase [Mameliella alba]MBY6168515.1 sulfotransferase [Mameliella alba]MBY6174264.1 sulfotransferase [Mameliella alba]